MWRSVTSDPFVLQWVQGIELQLPEIPLQSNLPFDTFMTEEEKLFVYAEVETLLSKGAVKRVTCTHGQFVSSIFLVPKKSCGFRPVINLRRLNRFLVAPHFKNGASIVVSPFSWVWNVLYFP